jgi:transcriptional regulator with XRE-family HTH domain
VPISVTGHVPAPEVAARIRNVLAGRGLTLSEVTRISHERYAGKSRYRIPHHFYADLRNESFSPRIEQLAALSAITNYRLVDWMALVGLPPDHVAPLAASLPLERTVILDATVRETNALVGWFRSRPIRGREPAIAPLGQFLEPGLALPVDSLLPKKPSPFLYAKIGREDAFAFPDLLPGSIVRVDTRRGNRAYIPSLSRSRAIYLVEHGRGFTCCRLHISRNSGVTLRSTQLPFAEVELELDSEVRIRGVVDLEFRFLVNAPRPEVSHDLAAFWRPRPLATLSPRKTLGELLRERRVAAGISLRQAAKRSTQIVHATGDERHFFARSTLATLETTADPRLSIHQVFALCALYSLQFEVLLAALGIETPEMEPIPVFNARPSAPPSAGDDGEFLWHLVENLEEIPLFLRNALSQLTGLPALSLRDLVWLGGQRVSLHPYLRGSILAAINRSHKTPSFGPGRPLWEQPLHLLLLRNGSYLCAACSFEKNEIVVRPFADGEEQPVRLKNTVDVEVAGQVIALLRRL